MNRAFALSLPLTLGFMLSATQARGVVIDDFNRPDSTNLGADWSEPFGDVQIVGNAVTGVDLFNDGILHTSFMSGSPDITLQVSMSGTAQNIAAGYSALIVRAAALDADFSNGDGVFVKVQDNDADGEFDRVFFNTGPDGVALNTIGATSIGVTPFTDATIRLTNLANQFTFGIDRGSDGSYEDSITRPASASFLAGLGNRVGFGMGGDNVTVDNFAEFSSTPPTNPIPEPATAGLLGLAAMGLLARRRRTA